LSSDDLIGLLMRMSCDVCKNFEGRTSIVVIQVLDHFEGINT
jgi:hypothetical protein